MGLTSCVTSDVFTSTTKTLGHHCAIYPILYNLVNKNYKTQRKKLPVPTLFCAASLSASDA